MTRTNNRRVSSVGLALITEQEGERLKAYLPTANDVWTIGVGHTSGVYKGMVITHEESQQLLAEDIEWVEDCINKYVYVVLTQNQFDALACFVFNVGCMAFKNSTLLKKLNNKDYSGAALQFGRWNKQAGEVLAGLTNRRAAEASLFNANDSSGVV